jgi:hypothetical protein
MIKNMDKATLSGQMAGST